ACRGGAGVRRSRRARQGAGGARAVRCHADPLSLLAGPAPTAGLVSHAGRRRRVRRPRSRVVRPRLGRLGRPLRPRASRRTLRAQPRRGPRIRRGLLAPAVVLPPPLLSPPPARNRLALDAVRGRRRLAALAPRRPARSAGALPPLLDRGTDPGVHARRVEAPLLPAAVRAAPGAADGAAGDRAAAGA